MLGSFETGVGTSLETGSDSVETASGLCAPAPELFLTDGASLETGSFAVVTAAQPPACSHCNGDCQSFAFEGTQSSDATHGALLLTAIPIDFSCLPDGLLKITFSAGDVRYDNGEDAGSSVDISASISPLFNVGDGDIWYTGPPAPNDGSPPDWNPILDVVNGTGNIAYPWPMTTFTNPNPTGIGYIKLYGNAGSGGPPGFETGFRNYAFQICAA